MQRITHSLVQGSAEWKAFRANHFGASEASAMLGMSPYKTRDQLLHEKATGLTKEVDPSTQKVFDRGHEAERLARPIVENLIGVELSPIVMSFGKLSASTDGLDFEGKIAWENKQFNKTHFEQVKNGELPEIHWPQCQQELLVTGAEKLFFTISDGTEENTVGVLVYPDQEKINTLVAGWAQFEADLASYVPPVSQAMPQAEVIMSLPSLVINARAEITTTNMVEYGEALKNRLQEVRSIVLITDQDFSNAKEQAKHLRESFKQAEQALEAMTAQNTSFDEAKRMVVSWMEDMRQTALKLEKDIDEEDKKKKGLMVAVAQDQYQKHLEDLREGTHPIYIPNAKPDFAGAIKGKKNYNSMQSAVNDLLAKSKAEANQIDMDIRAKQTWVKQFDEYANLFPDMQTIIFKATDDFKLLVESRIATQKAKDLAAKEKVEADARAKLEAEQRAKQVNEAKPQTSERASLTQQTEQAFTQQFEGTKTAPSRSEIVEMVMDKYGVTYKQAETWLVDMFYALAA